MVAHLALNRRQRLQIGKEIAHVAEGHFLVGWIWKSREIVPPIRRRPFVHRGDELLFVPGADAVLRVGRNVRHIECAEWGNEAEAAAKLGLVLLAWHGMAGGAAPDVE